MKLNSRQIALISVFAAFYYLASLLPGIPVPGISTVTIQIAATLAAVFGFVLGPFLGPAATLLGVSIAWALPPGSMSITDLLFIPSPVINALISGLLFRGRRKAAAVALGVLIGIFWFTPPVQPVTEFWLVGIAVTFDKIVALLLIGLVAFLDKELGIRGPTPPGKTPRPWLEVLRLFMMAFIGNEADNMWGSLIFAAPFVFSSIFSIDVETVRFLFLISPFAYPAIRFLQAIIATIIAAPLLRSLSPNLIPDIAKHEGASHI